MTLRAVSKGFAASLRQHGMVAVLIGLCAFFSWATIREQHPEGAAGGEALARQLARDTPAGSRVLIVTQETAEDGRFAEALEARLTGAGLVVAGRVAGDPRTVRQDLERRVADRVPPMVIATTPECAAWALLSGLRGQFPGLDTTRVVCVASRRWPTFLKAENLLNVANQIAVVAILAAGMTLVILTGGIDLSVGSLVALSAVVTTLLIRDHGGGTEATGGALVGCSLAAVMVCALVGAFSGAMVVGFRMPPFIATLAMMQVASGLAFILARGGSIYEVPEMFTRLGRGTGWLGVPHAVVLMLVIYGLVQAVLSLTVLGRHIYAVGSNAATARLCGVRVGWVLLIVYTLSGGLAGLGGVVLASQLKSGAPTYGLSYELYVIAAVVVGGTSLSGGEGRILGTLTGALIIAVIQNGMNLTNVESYTQKIVLGLVILGAVLLDLLKKQWRETPAWARRLIGGWRRKGTA